jgi:O-antigen/teichoic acid export membrane protein
VILAFSLIVTVGFVGLGKPFLRLVFGPPYEAAYVPMIILLVGQLVNSAAGSVGALLNMTRYEMETAKGMAVAAGVNVVLNFALIPVWGTIGAALATAVSLVTWNVLLWWSVRKRLGISSLAFGPIMRKAK